MSPFHTGRKADGRHYWLTPSDLMAQLQTEFHFDHDACPFPKPDAYDGLTANWGDATWVNPPFGSIIHEGKKKGSTEDRTPAPAGIGRYTMAFILRGKN